MSSLTDKTNYRIGILGGSFNPVHNDHLSLVNYVKDTLSIDKFIIIPNATPPHKNTCKVDFNSRVEMLKLSGFCSPNYEISFIEENNAIPHYSYDTLTKLQDLYKNSTLFFCMGMDSLLYLDEWKRGLELSTLCNLVVTGREGYSIDDAHEKVKPYLNDFAIFEDDSNFYTSQNDKTGHCFVLKRCFNDVSSSKIREELNDFYKIFAKNLDFEKSFANISKLNYCNKYLTKEVIEYIISHSLYKNL